MEASSASSMDSDDFPPEPRGRCYTWPMQPFCYDPPPEPSLVCREPTVAQLLASTPSTSSQMGSHLMPLGMPAHLLPTSTPAAPAKKKRCRKKPPDQLAQKKPNPWGEESYSDIIARALESAPDGRLKLSEIYQWFSDNIQYFRERSSQEEAAGWKNSIRHNLSLHSRFMRIQNEGAGKSSWWVINPEAKPGRNPRRPRDRAATIDSTNKNQMEKKRRVAKKAAQERRMLNSSLGGSTASILSQHDMYGDDDSMQPFDTMFRPRAQSNLSVPGSSSRVSPSMETPSYEDFEFPPWVDSAMSIPSDILDRTDQLRLDSSRPLINGIKQETKPVIKTEPTVPPPSYQELNSVRDTTLNPLLRNTHLPQNKFTPALGIPLYQTYTWAPTPLPTQSTPMSCAAQQSVSVSSALPVDLENLTLPDAPLIEMDIESVLRHELSQTPNHQINFDI